MSWFTDVWSRQSYWSKKTLNKKLPAFIGGQCQMSKLISPIKIEDEEIKEEPIYRGEISGFEEADGKTIVPTFAWLCEVRQRFDKHDFKTLHWVPVQPSPTGEPPHLVIHFSTFKIQRDEARLKLVGWGDEVCRLYQPGDHTNLVRCGDEYIPYCRTMKGQVLWKIVEALCKQKLT